jgi:hypothetical protein
MPLEMIAQYFVSWFSIPLTYRRAPYFRRTAIFGDLQLCAHGKVRLRQP